MRSHFVQRLNKNSISPYYKRAFFMPNNRLIISHPVTILSSPVQLSLTSTWFYELKFGNDPAIITVYNIKQLGFNL